MKKIISNLAIILLSVACIKKEKEEIHLFVDGRVEHIYRYFPYTDSLALIFNALDLEIDTDPKFDTLLVIVNEDTFAYYNNYKIWLRGHIDMVSIYNLKIESDIGEASASFSMPDTVKIIKPDTTLSAGRDCNIIWHKTKNAQWYDIDISYSYSGLWKDTTIITKDTSVVIDGSWFDHYGNVSIDISAINGIDIDDKVGNVKGNGIGYWLGRSTVVVCLGVK